MTAKAASAATWKKRVERWTASGLGCKEYAAKIGVNPNTLAGWRWKLQKETASASAGQKPDFVEVTEQLAAALAKEGGLIVEVACWAHSRRYFYKALASEPELARHALALIGRLFKIEEAMATAPRKKRESVRHAKSKPIVDAFFTWCGEQAAHALDGTPIAAALRYARNQRQALQRFLADGRLPLDNNMSELALRREAVGRKNWLFVGSDDGARANTHFVSLLASCQMHHIEPLGDLRDLFCLLPSWPRNRVLELAPASWKQTLQQEDAQQRLAANVFRRIALGEHAASAQPNRVASTRRSLMDGYN